MKEKIYTIPVTEAFKEECECPMCLLEKRFEDEMVNYTLGPSLMEPDNRIESNENGFCKKHFELLYNKQENRLGLGLIIDTHMTEWNQKFLNIYNKKAENPSNLGVKGFFSRMAAGGSNASGLVDDFIDALSSYEEKCVICGKLNYTMDRYIDVILYLWFHEEDFQKLFNSKLGFCLKHLKMLLLGAKKYLKPNKLSPFVNNLLKMQIENMQRIQEEVNWFTKKFDYQNQDAPWGNSRDAIPRSIQKLVGYSNLKQ